MQKKAVSRQTAGPFDVQDPAVLLLPVLRPGCRGDRRHGAQDLSGDSAQHRLAGGHGRLPVGGADARDRVPLLSRFARPPAPGAAAPRLPGRHQRAGTAGHGGPRAEGAFGRCRGVRADPDRRGGAASRAWCRAAVAGGAEA